MLDQAVYDQFDISDELMNSDELYRVNINRNCGTEGENLTVKHLITTE